MTSSERSGAIESAGRTRGGAVAGETAIGVLAVVPSVYGRCGSSCISCPVVDAVACGNV